MTTATAALSLSMNPSLFERLRVALRALRILEREPDDPIAGPVFNACLERAPYARLIERLAHDAQGARMLRERPSLNGDELDLASLLALPAGTLGHQIAAYYQANGIAPFHTTFEVRDDIDYMSKRYRETHDVFHLVTGYGTDVMGEMELQAFAMGNLRIKGPWMILAFSTVLLLRRGRDFTGVEVGWREYFGRLRAAFRRGKATPPMIAYPFEERFSAPLHDVRSELGL